MTAERSATNPTDSYNRPAPSAFALSTSSLTDAKSAAAPGERMPQQGTRQALTSRPRPDAELADPQLTGLELVGEQVTVDAAVDADGNPRVARAKRARSGVQMAPALGVRWRETPMRLEGIAVREMNLAVVSRLVGLDARVRSRGNLGEVVGHLVEVPHRLIAGGL